MSDIVIRAENLGKRYRLGEFRPGWDILRAANAPIRNLFSRNGHAPENENGAPSTTHQPPSTEILWALRDVSFEVQRGEVLGVIGRNGAGKSTLLKVLTRITEPTLGRAEIRGRVGSLLEVGTGFHPDLTGRDNIFLNGAILGMRRAEIKRKFAAIVDFAGIERFIDTPVKRYSSGMYVRLAFAVAAHLEPEILIVDEVLAVGDAAFQRRCLGRMQGIASEGRTVIFVSHNMQAVSSLCSRCLLLNDGRTELLSATSAAVERYLAFGSEDVAEAEYDDAAAPGDDVTRLRAVRVLNAGGMVSYHQQIHEPIVVEVEFDVLRARRDITVSIHVLDHQETCIFAATDFQDPDWQDQLWAPGRYRARCRIPENFFNEGRHMVSVFVVQDRTRFPAQKRNAASFMVHDSGATRRGYTGHWIGVVRPVFPWTTSKVGDLS